jgi:bidirectional [NiFe] hydrogenase diaphorase subunit
MPKKVSIKIDGELVSATEGMTILQGSKQADKYIPTLCHLDGLTDVGACRICIVEVSGSDRLFPACTTPVQDGMSVIQNSARLTRYRKISLELLLIEKNHVCAVCVSNNHCELQSMASAMGINNVRFAYNYPKLPVDMSHPRYVLDHNRCILCTRCVRVCAEVEGAHVWEVVSRGIHARIASYLNQNWGDAKSCTNCGKCVQVCPTGALAEKGKAVEEMVRAAKPIEAIARRKGGVHA